MRLTGEIPGATHQLFLDRGRPRDYRYLEPSNFCAIRFRYQARIVSGLATQAISRRAFLPTRLPISDGVTSDTTEFRVALDSGERYQRFGPNRRIRDYKWPNSCVAT